jgi:kinesin family protein 11
MQGNLAPSHTGHPPADAGMIPRVLSKLFSHLNDNVPDYSVKVSYVELYNEELRDLLAQELATPVGNMQPMGLGQGGGGGLKIFDEAGAGRKGVLIQGLEEMGVGSAEDAIALLRKGSHRRQIAATKFNDHSRYASLSLSIFFFSV